MNLPKRTLQSVGVTSVLALIVLCLLGAVYAQGGGATVRGTAVDSSGAVIPNVTVTLSCECKECPNVPCESCCPESFSRTVTTGDDGDFQIADVPPGVYVITGEASGFAKTTVRGVTVSANAEQRITLTFSAGEDSPPQTEAKRSRPGDSPNDATTQKAAEPNANPSPTPTGNAPLETVRVKVTDVISDKALAGATIVFFGCDCYIECKVRVCTDSCCPAIAKTIVNQEGEATVNLPAGEYKARALFGAYSVNRQIKVKSNGVQRLKLKLAINF